MSLKPWAYLIGGGIILSSFIAIITGTFIMVETGVIVVLWQWLPQHLNHVILYEFFLCILGGFTLSQLTRRWGALPITAPQTISTLRKNHTISYQHVLRNLLVALVVLGFGAGVGPAAALISTIMALSIWQADRLRFFYFQTATVETWPLYHQIYYLIKPSGHLQNYVQQPCAQQLRIKHLLTSLFLVNGIITFSLLMKITGQPKFITRLGTTHWPLSQFWVVLLAPLIGLVGKWLYHLLNRALSLFFQAIPTRFPRIWLGASGIFLFATLTPRLLFSGQPFLAFIPQFSQHQSGWILCGAALLKLLFLQICLKTGWIGGNVFPIIFASLLFGFGMAQLIPQLDTMLVVVVVATSLATQLLENLWLPSLVIALFFPLSITPVVCATALLQWGCRHIYQNFQS